MSSKKLEDRVSALEAEMALIKAQMEVPKRPWWEEISGTFENDPIYAEAMRLGREYRESTRPKPRKKRKVRHGSS
jgi:hypothetical protein